ncbi:hypothetical protein SAY87_001531 [Trapa incisa]|uniref:Myb-like domain-containing protein n=1 Tax=Trapa incisa TaxID=236973 RepID=A0AAN7JHP3_9MYRT|nr:hypothetical protein SAY87_001531 [Trapa incisa]
MSGEKVLFTYKRKRSSFTGALASEHSRQNLPPGDQEIHSQQLHDWKKPCSSCAIGRDSLDSLLDKKAGSERTEGGGEGSDAEPLVVRLNKLSNVDICHRDLSLKEDCCGQSLIHGFHESRSCPINTADSSHNDGILGTISETAQKDQYIATCNGSAKENYDFPLGGEEASNLEVGSTTTEEKATNLIPGLHGEGEHTVPLLTFSRRRKRKIGVDGINWANEAPGIRERACLTIGHHDLRLANDGGSIEDHTAYLVPLGHNSDATMKANQIKDAGSMSPLPEIIPGSEIKEVSNGKDVPLDTSASAGSVLKHDSESTIIEKDLPTMCSQSNATKDFYSEATNGSERAENFQSQSPVCDEFQRVSIEDADGHLLTDPAKELISPFLDLSVAPSDTGEQKESIDLNVSQDNNFTNDFERNLQDSLPFKSEVSDPSLQETSPSNDAKVECWKVEELIQSPKKRLLRDQCIAVDFNTQHHSGKSTVVFPAEVACASKCMQLFPEKKVEIANKLSASLREMADSRVSEAGEVGQLGIVNTSPEQFSGRHSFLGLSLPSGPMFGGCTYRDCSSVPFLCPGTENREYMPHLLPSSSTNERSLLRHKLMLDSFLDQAGAFNYHMAWSEEELDYLWIGVRRYGRSNWEAMLRDPRLHFSPFRMARDLAERWEEEQMKHLGGACTSQSKTSRLGIPAEYNGSKRRRGGGALRRNPVDEMHLSLGGWYTNRNGNNNMEDFCVDQLRRSNSHSRRSPYDDYHTRQFDKRSFTSSFTSATEANDGLPHWLKEAHIPLPRLMDQTVSSYNASSITAQPYAEISGLHRRRNIHPHVYAPMMQGAPKLGSCSSVLPRESEQNDLIVIKSDSSSEETISDDNCIKA